MADCGEVKIGDLKHRITIQSVTQTSDSQGGFTEAWATVATVWARVEPYQGRERFQASQIETPVTHKVTMRYRSGINRKQRFIYDGRTFHISEVINVDEGSRWLKLRAIEMEGTNA